MTIDERLQALTQTLELLASMQVHAEERHGRDVAELREGQIKFQEGLVKLEEGLVKLEEGHVKFQEFQVKIEEGYVKLQESQARTEYTLRRAIRLGVKEARNQRKRHQELEVLLKAFLERGGNGKH